MNKTNREYELGSIISAGELKELAFTSLFPSEHNNYPITDVDEMSNSIQVYGLITPLSVIGPYANGSYEIISGERRYTGFMELIRKYPEKYEDCKIPCYIVGDSNMPVAEKKLLIRVANITNRGMDDIQKRRFEVMELLKELEDSGNAKYKNSLKNARSYLKLSDRYGRMYRQIFENASDELKKLAEEGEMRIMDASRLSSMPKEMQDRAVEEIRDVSTAQEKSDIVSKYTQKDKPAKMPEKISVKLEDINSPLYDDLMDDGYDSLDLSVDRSSYVQQTRKMDARAYEESYQSKLNGFLDWIEKMMKKTEPTEEEWDVIDACKRLVDRFQ